MVENKIFKMGEMVGILLRGKCGGSGGQDNVAIDNHNLNIPKE